MAGNGSSLIWDREKTGWAGFNNATNASVYLHVNPNATIYGSVSYIISFQIINPPFDQPEQDIYIEAGGGSPSIIFIKMPKVRMVLSSLPRIVFYVAAAAAAALINRVSPFDCLILIRRLERATQNWVRRWAWFSSIVLCTSSNQALLSEE